MAEQVMDARSSAAFLRRRWRSIAAMAVVGATLGAVYVALVPAQLSSSTLLLFPAGNGSPDPSGEAITATQVHIVGSTPVLDRAGKAVRPALSGAQVQQRVKIAAKTSNLIEVRAFSRDAQQAQTLSEAVADAYIATLKDNLSSLSGVPRELSSREAALIRQLRDLRAQIAATTVRQRGETATSSNGIRDAQLGAELVNDQTDLLIRLDKVREAATQASSGSVEIPDIIQHAAPATGPGSTRRLLTWIGACAVLAATVTALMLLIWRRRDPRVRARDDLADAVGSSVLAVVHGRPQRSVGGWLNLFQTYEPPAEEAWAFRQVLRGLMGPSDSRDVAPTGTKPGSGRIDHPRSLTVIALSSDSRAVAVGPQLALFAASLGITTRLIVAARHESVASLRAACGTGRVPGLRSALTLEVREPEHVARAQSASPQRSHPPQGGPDAARRNASATTEPDNARTPEPVGLTIVLAVADRGEPTLAGLPATAVTMLAVSPGVASREELARLAVAVDDVGHRVDGVVVADRDPSDRTSGRHTLDERSAQAPLPLRITGAGQGSVPATTRGRAR